MSVDDHGKEYSGLDETHQLEVLDAARVSVEDMWAMTIDHHDDEYTGEALIDRELEQKNINKRICFDL